MQSGRHIETKATNGYVVEMYTNPTRYAAENDAQIQHSTVSLFPLSLSFVASSSESLFEGILTVFHISQRPSNFNLP